MSPISAPSESHTSSSHTSKGRVVEAREQERVEEEEGKGKRETEESGSSYLVSS